MSIHDRDSEAEIAERQMFLEKATRSIAELKPDVSSLADIVVFLEVLGYTNKQASEHGFQDLADLARNVQEFSGYYDAEGDLPLRLTIPIRSLGRRTAEAFTVAYPWVASYAVLLIFGVSLFLSEILPLDATTAFVIGIYSGLVISGGMSSFGRLFGFYDSQLNRSESRRILKRYYALLLIMLLAMTSIMYTAGHVQGIPVHLINISVASVWALSVLMSSFMIIYSKRKIMVIVYTYSIGLAALLSFYFLSANLLPDVTTRYFYSLAIAVVVMSIPSVYYHYSVFEQKNSSKRADNPTFYSPVSAIKNTLKSRFRVQMREILPYFIYGMLFFCILFGDRIVSWVYSPIHFVGGVHFFMLFNTEYHSGADSALVALFPSLIIQYVMLAPLHDELYNLSQSSSISETAKIQHFLSVRYKKMIATTVVSTIAVGGTMIYFGPLIMAVLHGSLLSTQIYDVAVISNIFMAVFGGNAMFLTFMNKIRNVCVIGAVGVLFVGGIGYFLGSFGFQYIVFAYLGESILLAIASFAIVRKGLDEAASIHLSRFV